MIYTIGYQALTPGRLLDIAVGLDATVVDVRNVPRSRKPGFSKSALEALLGARYEAAGDHLGGRGHTDCEGLSRLFFRDAPPNYRCKVAPGVVITPDPKQPHPNTILMCLEEAPGDCHRHHDICGPHFPYAIHIYRDELFTAGALNEAFAAGADAEYDLCGSLGELLGDTTESGELLA